jgi:hypothetical protein
MIFGKVRMTCCPRHGEYESQMLPTASLSVSIRHAGRFLNRGILRAKSPFNRVGEYVFPNSTEVFLAADYTFEKSWLPELTAGINPFRGGSTMELVRDAPACITVDRRVRRSSFALTAAIRRLSGL